MTQNDHSVQVDDTVTPATLNFSDTFNVTVPFLDRNIDEGRGDKVAVLWKNRELTFGNMAENVNRMANALRRQGVKPGERVMLLVKDVPGFYYGFLGAIRIGAIPIPVNYFLRTHDYTYMLSDSEAKVVLASPEVLGEIMPAIESNGQNVAVKIVVEGKQDGWLELDDLIADEDTFAEPENTGPETDCFWLYSSGSTGDPKASVHQHKDMVYTSQYYGIGTIGLTESSVGFSPPKAFFAYGLGNSVSFPLWTGSTIILLEDRPTPENTLEIMNEMKPTHYYGVPTLYAAQLQLLENGFEVDLSSIEFCASGGEALPPALYERWLEHTGLEIIDSIGSSEVLHFYTSNKPGEVKLGTAGPIVPGYEGRIVDPDGNDLPDGEVGELAIKGESTAAYYWNKPEKTAKAMRDGWFYTGDTCYRDEDGCYVFCGRDSDMLKVGGIWVSPVEIESALTEHSAVLEAAVTGAPDDEQLIKPKAFVVLKQADNAGPELEHELREFIRNRLAPFKYPRWIEFLDELPKTSSGKIQRFRLRSL